MFRKRSQPASQPTLSDAMNGAVRDWLDHLGTVPDGFDTAAYHATVDSVMGAVVAHGDAARRPEGRAALVKVLAATLCMTVYDGTDEDVFKIMDGVRGDLYAEVMKFRRAIEHDVRGKARADVE